MHLPLEHRNSSFSHVGTEGGAADASGRTRTQTRVSSSLFKVKRGRGSQSSLNEAKTHGSSVHPSYRRSYSRHHTSLTLADTRGRLGSGKLWWADTGTSLRARQRRENRSGPITATDRYSTHQRSTDCTHCTLQDSRQSCPRSHPPHRTSRRGACTKCCYTGTHRQGSDAQLGSTGRNRKCFMAAEKPVLVQLPKCVNIYTGVFRTFVFVR